MWLLTITPASSVEAGVPRVRTRTKPRPHTNLHSSNHTATGKNTTTGFVFFTCHGSWVRVTTKHATCHTTYTREKKGTVPVHARRHNGQAAFPSAVSWSVSPKVPTHENQAASPNASTTTTIRKGTSTRPRLHRRSFSSGDRREHVFKNGLGPRRGGRPKVTASSQDMTGSAHNAGWRGEGQTAGFSLPYFWVVREERGTSSDLQKLTQRTCVCAWACGQRRQQGKEVLDFASRPFPHHRCVHRFLGFGVSFVYSCSEMKCGASRPL
jgi:hypothetical protein